MRRISKYKKKLLVLFAMIIVVTAVGSLWLVNSKEEVHADVTDTVVFAEGYGTGKNFSSGAWKFAGQARNMDNANAYDISNHAYRPKILANPYSSEGEPIIRLIDGVSGNTDGRENDSSYKDYRSGEAFLSEGIKFNSNSAFSLKFTFSMPDAVVNPNLTNGDQFAREFGGDGIAFVMSTDSNHTTRAGSGIGYEGINNSIAIELDSFFNGAYYTSSDDESGTAYMNWGFDNQLYFHKVWQHNSEEAQKNNQPNYRYPNNPYDNGGDGNYVNYVNKNFSERFDHIGITLNGNVKKHEAISYINGLDPEEMTRHENDGNPYYEFKNLAYDNTNRASNTEDFTNTCSTRFTDRNVDNRLFTVWVDYDGTTMYVRYANGNFTDAERPNEAIIATNIDMNKFNGQTVYMGFTSAVGSSKANHTIHSFAFVNKFMADGIKTSYTEEYYIEVPDATSADITIGDKKYVKVDSETSVKKDIDLGANVVITDKSGNNVFKDYDEVDYSSKTSYPKTATVAPDGSTVLYQFFDLKVTEYTEKYYIEDPTATSDFVEIGGKKYKLQSEHTKVIDNIKTGTEATVTDLSKTVFAEYVLLGDQSLEGYPKTATVTSDGKTVVYQFYNIPLYDYNVEYYLEVSESEKDSTAIYVDGKWYNLKADETETKSAQSGTSISVSEDSDGVGVVANNTTKVDGTFKSFAKYDYNATATVINGNNEGTVSSTELTIQLFYDKNTTTYKGKYYIEIEDQTSSDFNIEISYGINDVKYKLVEELSYTSDEVLKGSSATIIDKREEIENRYGDKYELFTDADYIYPQHVEKIDDEGKTVVYQIYRLKPKYTVKYYIEVPKGTEGAIQVPDIDKYYLLQNDKTFTKSTNHCTLISFIRVDEEKAGVCEDGNNVIDSIRYFDTYKFSLEATNNRGNSNVLATYNDENLVELFFDKKITSYKEVYLVEMKDPSSGACDALIDNVPYERVEDDVIVSGKYIDSEATVTDKSTQSPYKDYILSGPIEGYPSHVDDIEDDGSTIVYQIYKLPSYTVKYYKEVFVNRPGVVEVNGKYYELQSGDTVENKTTAGTKVEYVKVSDNIAGVKEGTITINNTEKEYANYKFSESSTTTRGKDSLTVSKTDENIIELFFDAETTKYTMKYLIEVDDEDIKPGDEIITIGTTKYKVNEKKEITNLPLNADAVIVDKKGEEPYVNYELQSSTSQYPSEVTDIEDDGTTVVYQIYNKKPTYTINYYVEVEAGVHYDVEVDGKYYVLREDKAGNEVSTGTDIVYVGKPDKISAGVKEDGTEKADTIKYYPTFKFSADATESRGNDEIKDITRTGNNVIELFFVKKTTEYTEQYLVEIEDQTSDEYDEIIDGIKYEVVEENVEKDVPVDSKAEITDKSNEEPYNKYEILDPTPKYPQKVDDIDDDGKTVVYQIYRLYPQYTVKYYTEVSANTAGAVKVGNKYFVLKETVSNRVPTGTDVVYVGKSDKVSAGVTEDGTEKSNTIKYYPTFKFSADATELRGNVKITYITVNGDNVIELFFVKKTTEYTEKYLVEIEDQTSEDFDEMIDGIKYEVLEENTKNDVPVDSKAEIDDKSDEDPYNKYELLDPPSNYPQKVDDIDDNGKTVVYQIYRLHPQYTVKYYTEVSANTAGAVKVGNKYFVLKETVSNSVPTGTDIVYVGKSDKISAGVKEDGTEKSNTIKYYPTFKFSADATELRGNVKITDITVNGDNVIELFYVKKTTEYTEQYLVEIEDQTSDEYDEIIDGIKYKVVEESVETDVPVDSKAEITDKSDEEPFDDYILIDPTPEYPQKVQDIDDDGKTVVYQIYRLNPKYTVKYYVEVSANTQGAIKVGTKYYILKSAETVIKDTKPGTKVEYVFVDGKAGVKENTVNITDTLKSFTGYGFDDSATNTNGKVSGKVEFDTNIVIELFYGKNMTSYTQIYLVEIEDQTSDEYDEIIDGIKYKIEESEKIDGVVIDSSVKVEDKQDETPYDKYVLIDPPTNYPQEVEDVDDNGKTVVYQVYRLYPKYVVKYYTEVAEGTTGAVKVGNKWYILETDETVTNTGVTGTNITYVSTDDKTAGVKENNSNVTDTLKNFDEFTFADHATNINGKTSGTLAYGTPVVIELFYNKVIAEYKEMYWTEAPDATENFVIIVINGVEKKFILSEATEIPNVKPGTSVEVTDKSQNEDYSNYELVEIEVPNYPTSGVVIGSQLIVHQIYVLKPTYEVQYYLEVKTETPDSIEVDGRYYVIASEETMTKYASAGILVSVATNVNGTGVKEAAKEIADTFKKFNGYEFSQNATDKNGKNGGDVKADGTLVVMLMYNLVEEPTPEPPTPEPPTPEKPTVEKPDVPVTADGNDTSAILILMLVLVCAGAVVMYVANKRKAMN